LDKQDRRYLETADRRVWGGPTGVEAMAATMNVPADTLSDEVEPYLLARAIHRADAPRRTATAKAFTLLGKEMRPRGDDSDQPLLFLMDQFFGERLAAGASDGRSGHTLMIGPGSVHAR